MARIKGAIHVYTKYVLIVKVTTLKVNPTLVFKVILLPLIVVLQGTRLLIGIVATVVHVSKC